MHNTVSVQFSSVIQSCPALCDPMNHSIPGLPVHHQLPEFTQTHVHWVGDAIQPSHPLSSPSPLPSIFPSIRVFSNEPVLRIRWPKYWSFSFNISPTNEHPELISFRVDWLDLLAVQGTPKSLLQHHSSKASILQHSAFFTVQLSHPYMTTGKTIALTRWTFVDKVMSLLFNMLSRLVITFLPRSKHLLISWLQSPSAMILEPRKIKSATVSTVSTSIYHEVMGPDAMILVFWIFKNFLSLSVELSKIAIEYKYKIYHLTILSVQFSSAKYISHCCRTGFRNSSWTLRGELLLCYKNFDDKEPGTLQSDCLSLDPGSVWPWSNYSVCLSFLIFRMGIVFATESFCGDITIGNNGKGISSQKAELGPARLVLLYCQARKFYLLLISRIWYSLWCNVHLVLSLSVSCAGVFIVVIVFFLTSEHQV